MCVLLARETKSGILADRSAAANKESGRKWGLLIGDFENEFLERMTRLEIAPSGLFESGEFSARCVEAQLEKQSRIKLRKTSSN
jgi:hypothetical protein